MSGKQIVIVGSGMAGYTLAREFRKLDKHTPVTLISQDDAASYPKPALSNALTAGKTPEQIVLSDAQKMSQTLNINILANTRILSIDGESKRITLKNQTNLETGDDAATQTLAYEKLVLAVGASPIDISLEAGAQHLLQVNNLQDYAHFYKQLNQKTQSHVLILGAGLIGCEFANDLVNANHKATVVDLAAQPLGALLPEHLAADFTKRLTALGVEFVFNTSVQAVYPVVESNTNQTEDGAGASPRQPNCTFNVKLTNGDTLSADMVLSAVGLRPNTALAQQAGAQCHRGIVVDAYLQTSIDDIYAIGDCAEVCGHVLPYVMPLMNQARALAASLANSMAGVGEKTKVRYPAMPVGVKTPAAPLVVLPSQASSQETTWTNEPTEDGMIALAHSGGQLQGFALLGKTAAKQRLALAKQALDLL